VFFLHIPKTGGTAIGSWLQSVYRVRDYLDVDIPQVAACSAERLSRYRCYHSWHHGRNMLEFIGRPDLAVFTVLREPIERTVSQFDQHKRWLAKHPQKFRPEYLEQMQPLLVGDISNCTDISRISPTQTALLGNRRDYRTFFENLRRSGSREQLQQPFGISQIPTPSPFDDACAWLRSMPVVGLAERFAESMQLIADLLCIPPPEELPVANVNPRRSHRENKYRDALPQDTLARLEEHNRHDFELYALAQELFEQQWARFNARPRRTYSIAPRLRAQTRRARAFAHTRLRRS
jgi:hypothetical protein